MFPIGHNYHLSELADRVPISSRDKFTIADDEAVQVLVEKLLDKDPRQQRREKLLKALKQAARSYSSSKQKERQAFFHCLLTGYAVALKLWWDHPR